MVNIIEFKNKIKSVEEEYDLNHYEVLQRFMFERILERISISKYNSNFILKGGLLLSAIFGINERSTKDIDTTIIGIDISKTEMVKILNEILNIDLNDGTTFNIVNITDIREESEYGGNKYNIIGKIENIKVQLEIDISTGDKVTPREMKYKYQSIFENKSIIINCYNLETILAEKLETILRRGKFNSRMKDYYDVYYILNNLYDDIDILILNNAIKNTFNKRDSIKYLNDYKEIILSIKNGSIINNLWNAYSSKYKYACNIKFSNILETIENILDDINLKMV
jgi:Uncharacterized conserved protein